MKKLRWWCQNLVEMDRNRRKGRLLGFGNMGETSKGVHRGGVLGVLNISTEEEKRSGLEGNTISLSPICLKRQISFNRKFLMFSREENISLVLDI